MRMTFSDDHVGAKEAEDGVLFYGLGEEFAVGVDLCSERRIGDVEDGTAIERDDGDHVCPELGKHCAAHVRTLSCLDEEDGTLMFALPWKVEAWVDDWNVRAGEEVLSEKRRRN